MAEAWIQYDPKHRFAVKRIIKHEDGTSTVVLKIKKGRPSDGTSGGQE